MAAIDEQENLGLSEAARIAVPAAAGCGERADVYHRAPVPPRTPCRGMRRQGGLPARRDARPVGRTRGPPESGQVNVQSNNYWSGLEYAPNTNNAWDFNFNNGNQNANDKTNDLFAWAVRSGG